jgi:hypothetical protein
MIGLLIIAVLALIMIAAYLIRWERYRTNPAATTSSVRPTTEVFVDPETKQRKRVWYDPATGAREYRDEP